MIESDIIDEERLRRALSDRPDNASARVELALAITDRAEAIRILREGAIFADGRPDRLQVLAEGCARLDTVPDAIELYQAALRLDADNGDICAALARLWAQLGERSKAEAMAGRATFLGADPSLGEVRDGPTETLTRHLFDQYADRFEEHLLSKLDYAVPDHLDRLLERHSTGVERAIDLGCGTGLMGLRLRSRARWLAGVDLSPAMLEKARQKGCYDELAEMDITQFLADCPMAGLITAADVLGYIGDLLPVFVGVARSLTAGGLFAATVERHDGEVYALTPARRYAHSARYVEDLADLSGMVIVVCENVILRTDNSLPVPGYAFLARLR
jgi:predicted TPR repeat methyltransferase